MLKGEAKLRMCWCLCLKCSKTYLQASLISKFSRILVKKGGWAEGAAVQERARLRHGCRRRGGRSCLYILLVKLLTEANVYERPARARSLSNADWLATELAISGGFRLQRGGGLTTPSFQPNPHFCSYIWTARFWKLKLSHKWVTDATINVKISI